MKKFFLFAMALTAGLFLTACSSNEEEVISGPELDQNGTGFVSISINMPTADGATTRANGEFDDGDSKEYAVNDVILALFTNSSDDEDNATFVAAYTLDPNTWTNASSTQVTRYKQYTQKLQDITLSSVVYALVIINGDLEKLPAETPSVKQFSVNGDKELVCNGVAVTSGTKFSAVKGYVFNNIGSTTDGFLMSTAPSSYLGGGTNNPGGTGAAVHQLNNVSSNIKPTESEAAANPASIYVERAAAKITVTKGSTSGTVTDGSGLTYGDLYWKVDNYNTQFYPTRHFKADWLGLVNSSKYRFVEQQDYEGNEWNATTNIHQSRTTWGEDINYIGISTTYPLTTVTDTLPTSQMTTMSTTGDHTYVAENTMDADHMTWENTTRVIIAAKFNSGYNFCTTSTYPATLLTETSSPKLSDLTDAWITANKTALDDSVNVKWKSTYTNHTSNFSGMKYAFDLATGVITCTFSTALTDGDIASGHTLKEATTALEETLTKAIKNVSTGLGLKHYKDGLAYYSVRIRHFNDTETPWTRSGSTYGDVYGAGPASNASSTRNQDYLGRYGVLRNNWYQLEVSTIRSLGEPTIPELDDTPDDLGEKYLGVKISILKWGLRKMTGLEL